MMLAQAGQQADGAQVVRGPWVSWARPMPSSLHCGGNKLARNVPRTPLDVGIIWQAEEASVATCDDFKAISMSGPCTISEKSLKYLSNSRIGYFKTT